MEDITKSSEFAAFLEKVRIATLEVDTVSWNEKRRYELERESVKKRELLAEIEGAGDGNFLSSLPLEYYRENTSARLISDELVSLFKSSGVNVIEECQLRSEKYQKIKKVVDTFLIHIIEENSKIISLLLKSEGTREVERFSRQV